MPSTDWSPIALGLFAFDARAWSGLHVFTRGAVNVSLASFGDGEGVFNDAFDFIHGRCSQSGRDTQSDGQASWAASTGELPATFEFFLRDNDRFVVRTAVTTETFEINDGAEWGFADGQASVVVGVWNEVEAQGEAVRAVMSGFMLVDPGTSDSFQIPSKNRVIQNPFVAARAHGLGDLDDLGGTLTLEQADNDAAGGADRDIRWGLNAEGHVFCSRRSGTHDPITWASTSFRNRLGFNGLEVETTAGDYKILTATYKLPGCIPPSRETDRHEFEPKVHGEKLELMGGRCAGNTVGFTIDHEIEWFLDGPGDCTSMCQHFMRRVVPHAGPSAPLSWYQDGVGDTRRAAPAHIVTDTQGAYDLVYTTQDDGFRGRIIGHLLSDQFSVRWPSQIMRRVPITFVLREIWDGE